MFKGAFRDPESDPAETSNQDVARTGMKITKFVFQPQSRDSDAKPREYLSNGKNRVDTTVKLCEEGRSQLRQYQKKRMFPDQVQHRNPLLVGHEPEANEGCDRPMSARQRHKSKPVESLSNVVSVPLSLLTEVVLHNPALWSNSK